MQLSYSLHETSNIPEIFGECSLSLAMFRTFREHFKGKRFLESLDEKVAFVLKRYDLIITNVDLLANSSNLKVMFPEYSRSIPRMSVSKKFQEYPRDTVRF